MVKKMKSNRSCPQNVEELATFLERESGLGGHQGISRVHDFKIKENEKGIKFLRIPDGGFTPSKDVKNVLSKNFMPDCFMFQQDNDYLYVVNKSKK